MEKLHKNLTGIASEFLVAGELARRGYNVAFTFGNTKNIDLFIEKNGKLTAVQVKGIQDDDSNAWNPSLEKIRTFNKDKKYHDVMYVFVNLHSDTIEPTEFFVMTSLEVEEHTIDTGNKRNYMRYKKIKDLGTMQNRWDKFENE